MSNESKRSIDSETEQEKCKKQRHLSAQDSLKELKHADPVLELSLTEDDSPIISPTSKNLLADLLYPLSPSEFKVNCFRKKAVHIRSNRNDRGGDVISNYMFGLDPKQIFEETSSDSIFLWIPTKRDTENSCSNANEKNCLQSIDVQDPNTAHILHTNSKYASYCRAPPELEQLLVSSMLRETGFGLGQYDPTGEKLTTLGRGEVETFIGTKGHVTDWHTDFQENFTIQLSGRKKWTLKQGTVKHPLRGTTPHYRSSSDVIENQIKAARLSNPNYQFGKQDLDSNAFGDETEIVMDAGDVLYFPAGMWHKVETLEEGVSINISLMGTTYASLFCRSLEHLLLEKEEWREIICSQNDMGHAVVEKLKNLINDLPSILQKSSSKGLAEGILPPVLRHPPAFELVDQEIEAEQLSEDDATSEIDILPNEGEADVDFEEKEATDCEDTEGQALVNDDDENIVDVDDFEMPENFVSVTSRKRWKRNPLASLMKMSDVKSYFGNNTSADCEAKENLYILNVNFAGNEMHESTARVILRDSSGQLEHLCSHQGKSLDDAIEKIQSPPNALIYHGYLVPIE